VQYHVARNYSIGGLARMSEIVMRCAATFPAAEVPAAIVVSRRAETRAQVIGPELFEGPGQAAETHQVEEQLRRIPL
jgi:hypothetical protein